MTLQQYNEAKKTILALEKQNAIITKNDEKSSATYDRLERGTFSLSPSQISERDSALRFLLSNPHITVESNHRKIRELEDYMRKYVV